MNLLIAKGTADDQQTSDDGMIPAMEKCRWLVEDEFEQVEQHACRRDVCHGIEQVGQGDPQQLIVLRQRREGLKRAAVILSLDAQRTWRSGCQTRRTWPK